MFSSGLDPINPISPAFDEGSSFSQKEQRTPDSQREQRSSERCPLYQTCRSEPTVQEELEIGHVAAISAARRFATFLPNPGVVVRAVLGFDRLATLFADLGEKHRAMSLAHGLTALFADLGVVLRAALHCNGLAALLAYLSIEDRAILLFDRPATLAARFNDGCNRMPITHLLRHIPHFLPALFWGALSPAGGGIALVVWTKKTNQGSLKPRLAW